MSIQSKTHSLQAAIPGQTPFSLGVNQRVGEVRQPLTGSLDRPIFSHFSAVAKRSSSKATVRRRWARRITPGWRRSKRSTIPKTSSV
jgi:hypothetical protein